VLPYSAEEHLRAARQSNVPPKGEGLRMRAPSKLFAILFLFALCNARASTFTSEITDMWWNPAESGWGVNIILQNSVAFATFLVKTTISSRNERRDVNRASSVLTNA
jgi:hypothetical protein